MVLYHTPASLLNASLEGLLSGLGYGRLNRSLILAHVAERGSASTCRYVRYSDHTAVRAVIARHTLAPAESWGPETDRDTWQLGPAIDPEPTAAAAEGGGRCY